jgi:hypothetical protein
MCHGRQFAHRDEGANTPASRNGASYTFAMSQSILERRLVDVSERLKRMRAELEVVEEQLAFLEQEAEDVQLRALVAETPLADVEARDARRHADAFDRQRSSMIVTVRGLEQEQNELLDRISAELSAR